MFEMGGFNPIDCSTGSLGQGLPIATGMAMADRSKNVYCMVSDGEMAEGSISEAMKIRQLEQLRNMRIYVNNNGWAAYREVGFVILEYAPEDVQVWHTDVKDFPFLKGQDAHYVIMSKDQYEEAMRLLSD